MARYESILGLAVDSDNRLYVLASTDRAKQLVDVYRGGELEFSFAAYRAPTAPHTFFAIDSQMELMAQALGVDAVEFRMRHLMQEGDPMANGQKWQSNGAKQVLSLKIDPEAVSKDDVDMLQDLILAALNDAQRKADEAMSKQMQGMMGGAKIPGLF